ncbi:MAG: class I SAM-dependent methyltransferase [Bacillota bacterium]
MEQLIAEKIAENHFDVERQRVFDHMAPQWDAMIPQVPSEKISELIAAADVEGKIVLDVGAGTGALVEAGLAAGPGQWIACDLSLEMLKILEAKFKGNVDGAASSAGGRLSLLHADVHSLPLEPASVDRVICHHVFPHFKYPKIALNQLFRVMRPGGLLIINHFSGREFINRVHSSSPQAVLHKDLLVPAEEAAEWLREVGFAVTGVVDSPQMYRITAVRPGDGWENGAEP